MQKTHSILIVCLTLSLIMLFTGECVNAQRLHEIPPGTEVRMTFGVDNGSTLVVTLIDVADDWMTYRLDERIGKVALERLARVEMLEQREPPDYPVSAGTLVGAIVGGVWADNYFRTHNCPWQINLFVEPDQRSNEGCLGDAAYLPAALLFVGSLVTGYGLGNLTKDLMRWQWVEVDFAVQPITVFSAKQLVLHQKVRIRPSLSLSIDL